MLHVPKEILILTSREHHIFTINRGVIEYPFVLTLTWDIHLEIHRDVRF